MIHSMTSADSRASARIEQILKSTFGHDGFRPHQDVVCLAVAEGRDTLLVMPTGAGKSLCYQLPGLARKGATLVISPLIALMEDQVAALVELGIRADRIHSGRERETSRAVCREYLSGKLDFLFVAPERLRVPGFPELLAKHRPSLVAVDEAHCISQWGHDFRPDYRQLGRHLETLRPAVAIALTATATPRVQADIVDQLGLENPLLAIHGFRRTNLAIEIAEMPPSARSSAVAQVLCAPENRPAIVYTPTRKEAEALAEMLSAEIPATAYHAGLPTDRRDKAQTDFLSGSVEVVVATIAFGMGIDKADVRTVIHTALPGTLEAYSQEIGRAGRDGRPSRAVLLWSWADRRTQEFFLSRDYPEPTILSRLFSVLDSDSAAPERLAARTGLELDVVNTALEKLWIHGGAMVTPEGDASRGINRWCEGYKAQREHRRAQLEDMSRFAQSRGCRMVAVVDHFGDREDDRRSCGMCDSCAPAASLVRRARPATRSERELAARILSVLGAGHGQSTGQICRALGEVEKVDRKTLERVLQALVRESLVDIWSDSFEKNGRRIHFERAAVTAAGRRADEISLGGLEVDAPVAAPKKKKPTKKKSAKELKPSPAAADLEGDEHRLFDLLREWRLSEARKRRTPAFRILTDRTLRALARAKPSDEDELLEVHGMGPALVRKWGRRVLEIVIGGDWR